MERKKIFARMFFFSEQILLTFTGWLLGFGPHHLLLLQPYKSRFWNLHLLFQFDVWVAAMNNFEIKSKQNSWCCAFIGKKLTNFNFKIQMHFYLEMLTSQNCKILQKKFFLSKLYFRNHMKCPKSWLSNPCDSIHTIKIESWWGCTAIPDATQHRIASNNNYDCRLHCRLQV